MITTLPVTKAKPEDRSTILEICERNWSENGQFSYSPKKVEAMVDRAFSGGGAVIGRVGDAQIEGVILMVLGQHWYTEAWSLEEVMSYVLPEYRRSTHAKDMIKFAKRCADEIGIPLVIGVVSNDRTKAKIELYRRQLGDPVGGYFLYPRNGVQPAA